MSTDALERYLDRASRLKKHFQEVLFLEAETYQVAERIPWTRHQRRLGELVPFDQVMALAETFAHLEVLCLQARLTVSVRDSLDEFDVA